MPYPIETRWSPPTSLQTRVTLGLFGSFALAATTSFSLTLKAYTESFNGARLNAVLIVLVLLHLLRYPRFFFCREFALYSVLVGYMTVGLLWTEDVALAMNTVEPALGFLIILILFGALVTYHDLRAVLGGTLGGFVVAATYYTFTKGFPFVRPDEFSYNAIAVMYLFGLFATLTLGWHTRLAKLSITVGLILLLHVLATTSIKANLGILLGAMAAGLRFYRPFLTQLRRKGILIVAMASILTYSIFSSDKLAERLESGVERVALGVAILSARADKAGYSGFAERKQWTVEGLEKWWATSPVLGNGAEAFRDLYGATSHSTPTDLLYNFGLIGFLLFYAIFISIAWRLFRVRGESPTGLQALVLGTLICFLFITLSGTMHYNTFLAAAIAISTALLSRYRRPTILSGIPPLDPRL